MRSYSAGLATALANPGVTPRVLVSIATAEGTYRVAQEQVYYLGEWYSPRLLGPVTLTTDIRGAGQTAPAARQVSIELANADGFFSRWRPETYRQAEVTITEAILEVPDEPLRQTIYTATAAAFDRTRFRLDAVDPWADVGRQLVPNRTLTTSMYPKLPPESQGKALSRLYGRTLVPLVLVDEETDPDNVFFACVGSANWGSSTPTVVQAFADTFFVVESVDLRQRTVLGVPLTEVLIRSPIRVGGTGAAPGHYADLVGGTGSEQMFPDAVLLDLLTDPLAAPANRITVDSPALAAARSFYQANSMGFSCVLDTQENFDTLLGAWTHDALTHLTLRDKLYLVPEGSRAAVAALGPGSILRDTTRVADVPLALQEATHRVQYRDRTLPVVREETYAGGSGAVVQVVSPFLGTPSQAQHRAQFWAKRAQASTRTYEHDLGISQIGLDPGDFVTLTLSLYGADHELLEVVGHRTELPTVHLEAATIHHGVFATTGLPPDPQFRRMAQRIFFGHAVTSYALTPTVNSFGFTSSHQLFSFPTVARAVWANQIHTRLVTTSLVVTTDSMFTVQFTATGSVQNLQLAVQYLDLRL